MGSAYCSNDNNRERCIQYYTRFLHANNQNIKIKNNSEVDRSSIYNQHNRLNPVRDRLREKYSDDYLFTKGRAFGGKNILYDYYSQLGGQINKHEDNSLIALNKLRRAIKKIRKN